MDDHPHTIFVCSDSVGETAEAVARAAVRQFNVGHVQIKRWAHVKSEEDIRQVMEEAARIDSFVVYTIVLPELRAMIRQEAVRLKIFAVDVMGPVMEAFVHTFNDSPAQKPGLLHRMDKDYFKRVEAVEYAVKADDGKDPSLWKEADLILLGVSRSSKTPLSIFLAHKGLKVANYPLVPEVKPPGELYEVEAGKFIGLTMKPEILANIRAERLKSMGLPFGVSYASLERVVEELEYARNVFRKLGCMTIDVTERAIEETAGTILESVALR